MGMAPMTFDQWFSRIKWQKSAYSAGELKPLLQMCWNAANPPKKETRSQQQNRYYWGVVLKTIGLELGYEPEEAHQIFAAMFLSYEKDNRTFTRSTTTLKTNETEDYLEKVRRFAAMELSINVPLPNEIEKEAA